MLDLFIILILIILCTVIIIVVMIIVIIVIMIIIIVIVILVIVLDLLAGRRLGHEGVVLPDRGLLVIICISNAPKGNGIGATGS